MASNTGWPDYQLRPNPLSYVYIPNHTLHFKGGKSVPLVGKGKYKQINGTFSCTKSEIFLPMQLINQGKTNRCHPTGIEFPEGFNITHTKNHWSNEDKVIEHLESIIFPFAKSKRADLHLEEEQNASSFLMLLRLNAPDVFLIWSMKTIVLLCS